MVFKRIGGALQPMVDVDGTDLAWPFFHAGQQQSHGVGTATQCYGQGEVWMERGNGLFDSVRHAQKP